MEPRRGTKLFISWSKWVSFDSAWTDKSFEPRNVILAPLLPKKIVTV